MPSARKGLAPFPYRFSFDGPACWQKAIQDHWRRRHVLAYRGVRRLEFAEDQFVYETLTASKELSQAIQRAIPHCSIEGELGALIDFVMDLPRRWLALPKMSENDQERIFRDLSRLLDEFCDQVEKYRAHPLPPLDAAKRCVIRKGKTKFSPELLIQPLHPRLRQNAKTEERVSFKRVRHSKVNFERFLADAKRVARAIRWGTPSLRRPVDETPTRAKRFVRKGLRAQSFAVRELDAFLISKLFAESSSAVSTKIGINGLIAELANSAFLKHHSIALPDRVKGRVADKLELKRLGPRQVEKIRARERKLKSRP